MDGMTERDKCSRQGEIAEYSLILDYFPVLKRLAIDYWNRVLFLEPGPESIKREGVILTETVIQIANVLLDSPIFMAAMRKSGADPLKSAIYESLITIDIVQDL